MNRVIWVAGMPRSGTNWIGQIFASNPDVRFKLCPLFSYDFKNALDERSDADAWHRLLEATYSTHSDYLDQEYLRKEALVPNFAQRNPQPSTLTIKSTRFHHLLPRLLELVPTANVVGIVRDPRAAIHSWLTNPLEFPSGADPRTEWKSGHCRKTAPGEYWGFDDWRNVANLFLDLQSTYADRFHLLEYERCVEDPTACIKGLFPALGLDVHAQTETFLVQSRTEHKDHPRAVFKHPGVSTRWKSELDPDISAEIVGALRGTRLASFLSDEHAHDR